MVTIFRWAVRGPLWLLAILFGFLGIRSLTNPDRPAVFFGYEFPNGGLGLSSLVGHPFFCSWHGADVCDIQ